MKKGLAKIVTLCSLALVVGLFIKVEFSEDNDNNIVFSVYNNNLNKMDENTLLLFEQKDIEEIKEEVVNEEKSVIPEEQEVTPEIVEEIVNNVVEENIEQTEEEPQEEEKEEPVVTNLSEEKEVLQTVVGTLTGYGADCVGCSGITSSGFDLTKSIYYDDSEYGKVRILAADPSFPFYSIIRVSNVPTLDDFIGIVLDRGGNVGFGRGTLFDLAYFSEYDPELVPLTRNVTFELLRSGK